MITAKQKIMETYIHLIKEKHHATLSVKEITAKTSISRTTFYCHFKDKEEVFQAVRSIIYDELLSYYNSPSSNSISELREINVMTVTHHIFKYRDFYKIVFQDAQEIQYLSNLLATALFKTYNDQDYALFASYGIIGYLSIWVKKF